MTKDKVQNKSQDNQLQFQTQASKEAVSIKVSSHQILKVTGTDAKKFLQGQVTCDLNESSWENWISGGYCDPKGKLLATFWLFGADDCYYIIMHQNSISLALEQFKKFSIFSQVHFDLMTGAVTAYWGTTAIEKAQATLLTKQSVEQQENQTILLLAKNLVLSLSSAQPSLELKPDLWWQAALMEHGWVDVPQELAAEYIPQMLNLDLNSGVNFKKGCYLGQEIVARMHFKGRNNRQTRLYQGQAKEMPKPGQTLEKKVNENWRRAGAVLNSVRYDSGVVALYAVGPIEEDPNRLFRIQGQDDSQFTLCPLKIWNPNHE